MITFKEKTFTDADIVRRNSSKFIEALEHFLKLKYGFNFDYDHEGHIKGLVSFISPAIRSINKKGEKSKGPDKVFKLFMDDFNETKFIRDTEGFFRNKYNFGSRKISHFDVVYALDMLKSCLYCKNEVELRDYLIGIYGE